MADESGELPRVPDDLLSGWTRTEATSETVFSLSAAKVVGHTSVYEDQRLRSAIREATDGDLDRMWRFFFATRLTFSPPLPPGVGPVAVFSTVQSQAESEFVDILHDRGFRDVSPGARQRVRVDTGDRARLRSYSATVETARPDGTTGDLATDGWLGVWTSGGQFRLAGGAYPARPLDAFLDLDLPDVTTDPDAFREDLLSLVRAVQ